MHPAPSLAELLQSDDPSPRAQSQQEQPHQQPPAHPQDQHHGQGPVSLAQADEVRSLVRINTPPIRYVTPLSPTLQPWHTSAEPRYKRAAYIYEKR